MYWNPGNKSGALDEALKLHRTNPTDPAPTLTLLKLNASISLSTPASL